MREPCRTRVCRLTASQFVYLLGFRRTSRHKCVWNGTTDVSVKPPNLKLPSNREGHSCRLPRCPRRRKAALFFKNYNRTLAATGGTTPYTWSVVSGSLPPGLSLNAATGVVSGRATTLGTFAFTVQVRDSQPTPATDGIVDHGHQVMAPEVPGARCQCPVHVQVPRAPTQTEAPDLPGYYFLAFCVTRTSVACTPSLIARNDTLTRSPMPR